MPRPHHRPLVPGDAFFDAIEGAADPALIAELAERTAELLVRGARASGDAELIERLVHLAEEEGLEALAELWAQTPPSSVAGSLWRLYLLREWVHAQPLEAARQFEAGRGLAEVDHVVAGVAEPPGPEQLRVMVDEVLRGIAHSDFGDVLLRATAFARVIAAGRDLRATAGESGADLPGQQAAAMADLADQLEIAARTELAT